MKKNIISLAVAATVLGGAAAQAGQYVNPDKTGEVILFPFYNADNGNATYMHIVNTSATLTKAVKVRFMEYKNSDEVLDFNVYLSPNDHFSWGVIKDPNGAGAAIITKDNTCTVPQLGSPNGDFAGTTTENADGSKTRVQPFVNYLFAKDVDTSIERTLTGHVEVIEMGTVSNFEGATAAITKASAHASFAKHGPTGIPASCAGLDKSWAGGTWKAAPNAGIAAPSGDIYGLAFHIDVDDASAFGFEPTAIDQKYDAANHHSPGDENPSLTQGVLTTAVHHGLIGDQFVEITQGVNGSAVEATSLALQTESLINDVMINSAVGGMTDWVVTFPTKRHHVDVALKANVVPPFVNNWLGSTGTTTKKEQPACEFVSIGQTDREESFVAPETGFSPSLDAVTSKICNETAVVAMGPAGTASALNVSTGLTNLGFAYTTGWQQMRFNGTGQAMPIYQGQITEVGLPAIGFAAYRVSNGAMSYGHTAEHKTTTVFSGVPTQPEDG